MENKTKVTGRISNEIHREKQLRNAAGMLGNIQSEIENLKRIACGVKSRASLEGEVDKYQKKIKNTKKELVSQKKCVNDNENRIIKVTNHEDELRDYKIANEDLRVQYERLRDLEEKYEYETRQNELDLNRIQELRYEIDEFVEEAVVVPQELQEDNSMLVEIKGVLNELKELKKQHTTSYRDCLFKLEKQEKTIKSNIDSLHKDYKAKENLWKMKELEIKENKRSLRNIQRKLGQLAPELDIQHQEEE